MVLPTDIAGGRRVRDRFRDDRESTYHSQANQNRTTQPSPCYWRDLTEPNLDSNRHIDIASVADVVDDEEDARPQTASVRKILVTCVVRKN